MIRRLGVLPIAAYGQLNRYATRMNVSITDPGFIIFDDVLSGQECDALAKSVSVTADRAGARNLMSNPTISSFVHDSRMCRIASGMLGTDAFPYRATLFDKSTASNWHVLWHQDRALPLTNEVDCNDWGPWSTKCGVLYALAPAWALESVVALRVHLDASIETNGPLRVISGSHKNGIMSADQIFQTVRAASSTACVVGRGGVLGMRPLLLHSSSKAIDSQRRRVLHIEYANRFDFGGGLHLRVA